MLGSAKRASVQSHEAEAITPNLSVRCPRPVNYDFFLLSIRTAQFLSQPTFIACPLFSLLSKSPWFVRSRSQRNSRPILIPVANKPSSETQKNRAPTKNILEHPQDSHLLSKLLWCRRWREIALTLDSECLNLPSTACTPFPRSRQPTKLSSAFLSLTFSRGTTSPGP